MSLAIWLVVVFSLFVYLLRWWAVVALCILLAGYGLVWWVARMFGCGRR
jgi:hypothetical protein